MAAVLYFYSKETPSTIMNEIWTRRKVPSIGPGITVPSKQAEQVAVQTLNPILAAWLTMIISKYLWQQKCYYSESAPVCRGPHTPLLCFCLRWKASVLPSLQASWLYNRWEMFRGVFRVRLVNSGAETPQFGFGWTQIKEPIPAP